MITKRFGIPSASPGAILREEKRAGSALGREADLLTSQGKMVSDQIVVSLVGNWLNHHDAGFIFDGFPRSLGQANALERELAERISPLDVVLAFDAETSVLQQRVANRVVCSGCGKTLAVGLHVANASRPCPSCGAPLAKRTDDTPETLLARLEEYSEKTSPLIGYYESRGLLQRVNGAESPEMVFASIAAILES